MRIGIVGGMGPLAGIQLQTYIVEATPAKTDQQHIPVLYFCATQIPDRSASLAEDGGESYMRALTDAAQVLVRAGAEAIAIPCNTAHSLLAEIQKEVPVLIVNMVRYTVEYLLKEFPNRAVGLLATDGTIRTRIYQSIFPDSRIRWITPSGDDQIVVMNTIYKTIKAKPRIEDINYSELVPLINVGKKLVSNGAEVLVAGCTELSLVAELLSNSGVTVVDPMRILANELVKIGKGSRACFARDAVSEGLSERSLSRRRAPRSPRKACAS